MLALRRGGQAELHGGREVFQNAAPLAFVIGAAAVAFVDDDEVEEVGRVAFVRLGLPSPVMKVWKMVKNTLAFFGTPPFLRIVSGSIAGDGVGVEGGKGVVGLIGQDVAVGEEQDARAAGRFAATGSSVAWNSFQAIWKAMEVLPVPVAKRQQDAALSPSPMASSTALMALCW